MIMDYTIKAGKSDCAGLKEDTAEKNKASMLEHIDTWPRNEKDTITGFARNFFEGGVLGGLALLIIDHFARYTPTETISIPDLPTNYSGLQAGTNFPMGNLNFHVVSETQNSMVLQQVLPGGKLGNMLVFSNDVKPNYPFTVLTIHNNVVTSMQNLPVPSMNTGFTFQGGLGTNSYLALYNYSLSNGSASFSSTWVQYHLAMVPNWAAQFLSPEHITLILGISGVIGGAIGIAAKFLRKQNVQD